MLFWRAVYDVYNGMVPLSFAALVFTVLPPPDTEMKEGGGRLLLTITAELFLSQGPRFRDYLTIA